MQGQSTHLRIAEWHKWQNNETDTIASTATDSTSYTYSNNLLVEQLKLNFNNATASWDKSYHNEYIYDDANRIKTSIGQTFLQGQWYNDIMLIWHYNLNGFLDSTATMDWDGFVWIPKLRVLMINNDNGQPISQIFQSNVFGVWYNYNHVLREYNTQQLEQSRIYQNWSGSDWVNFDRFDYTYTTTNKLDTITEYEWETDHWRLDDITTHLYNTDECLVRQFEQNYINGSFFNASETIYECNGTTPQGLANHLWLNGAWQTVGIETFVYDEDRRIRRTRSTNEGDDEWKYYYAEISAITDFVGSLDDICIFPNPTTQMLYIKNLPDNAKVELWSAEGIPIKININSNALDVTNLASGIYLLQVSDNERVSVKKVIVQQ